MCGLAGSYARQGASADEALLLAMAGELRHRGPDGTGLYLDGRLGMVNTRLAIVDLEGGDQPLPSESGRFWAMQNGEIYNHVELRAELERAGHRFATHSDTEVIAHAYEEWGVGFLDHLNGDFAIALWDRETRTLLLARDRFGIRPLFLADWGGDLCFASEAKALLRHPAARREVDPVGIVDTFTLWATLPDHSALAGIRELPPAHLLIVGEDGVQRQERWWDIDFAPEPAPTEQLVDELDDLLCDATRLRLRADVPVATYLSGGLDSSVMASIASSTVERGSLHAFGVGFEDERFDESAAQAAIARELGVVPHSAIASATSIAEELPACRRACREATAANGAGTASEPLGCGPGRGPEGRADRRGRGRAVRGLRHLPRGPRAAVLGARPAVAEAAAAARQAQPLPGRRPGQGRGLPPPLLLRAGSEDTGDPLYSHRCGCRTRAAAWPCWSGEEDHGGRERRPGPRGPPRPACRMASPAGAALARTQCLEIILFSRATCCWCTARSDAGSVTPMEVRFPFLDLPRRRRGDSAARRAAPTGPGLAAACAEAPARRRPRLERRLPPTIAGPAEGPVPRAETSMSMLFGRRRPEYLDDLLSPAHVRSTGSRAPRSGQHVVAPSSAPGTSRTEEMAIMGFVTLMLFHEQFVASLAHAAGRGYASRHRRHRHARRPFRASTMSWAPPQRLLHESLLRTADELADKRAVADDAGELTYGELLDSALRFARELQERGLERGARVALHVGNSAAYAVTAFGTLLAGGTIIFVNHQTKRDKLAYILERSSARRSSSPRPRPPMPRRRRRAATPGVRNVYSSGGGEGVADLAGSTLAASSPEPARSAAVAADLAALIYTSGTTGHPKGVMMSHGAFVASTASIAEYLLGWTARTGSSACCR